MKNLGTDPLFSFTQFYNQYYGKLLTAQQTIEKFPQIDFKNLDFEKFDLNKLVEPFCQLSKEERPKCLKTPSFYFQAHKFEMATAAKISAKGNVISQILPQQTFSSRFSTHQVVADRETSGDKYATEFARNENFKVGFEELGNGVTKNISFAKKDESYRATEVTFTTDTSKSQFATLSVAINSRVLYVPLDITFVSCVLIEPTHFTKKTLPRESYLFCSDKRTKEGVAVPWYYLKEATEASPTALDNEQLPFQGWWKIIRGKKIYDSFTKEVVLSSREFGVKPMLEKKEQEKDNEGRLASVFEDPYLTWGSGTIPGLITITSTSQPLWTAEQKQHFFQKYYRSKVGADSSDMEKRALILFYRCFTEMISREIPYGPVSRNLSEDERRRIDVLYQSYHEACSRYAKGEI
jgi:hypothetical protein